MRSLMDGVALFEAAGAHVERFDAGFWEGAVGVFAPIQAAEAAVIHAGRFGELEPVIGERLRWGAAFTEGEVAGFRVRRADFCEKMAGLFERFDYLLLPSSPMERLVAGADHSATRGRLLRYTAPMSLAGSPGLVLPGVCGLQLVGRVGGDAELLACGVALGEFGARQR